MKKGVFCLSLDTELLWGRRHQNLDFFIPRAKKVRPIIKQLLTLFKKYDFPATWAVVGKLFLAGKPLWSGLDIIDWIKKTPHQEIACHTFNHLTMTDCQPKQADADLKEWLKSAKRQKIKSQSFIFPFNKIGHLKTLKKHGFKNYRGQGNYWFEKIGPFNKIGQIVDYLLYLPPPISKPYRDQTGLICLPESMFYVSMWGARKYIPLNCRIIKAKKGIQKAIQEKSVFHLWFHPINLSDQTEKLMAGLEEIIQYAAQQRDQNKLEIKSMAQISGGLG